MVGHVAALGGTEVKKKMSNTNTLESRLNAAIEEKGFRISPRLGLEDRLARYIELSWAARGESVTQDEVSVAVSLTMMGQTAAEDERPTSRRSQRVAAREDAAEDSWQPRRSLRVAARDADATPEDSWQPRRSQRVANRTVTETNDSLRVTFTTGSHPMVRRSQVARR